MSKELPTPFVGAFLRCAYCLELEVPSRPGPDQSFYILMFEVTDVSSVQKKYEFDE